MRHAATSVLVFALLMASVESGCVAATQGPTPGFDGSRAFEHLKAQVAIGPRVAGTPANAKTRQYIIKTLAGSASRRSSSRSRPARRSAV